MKKYIDLAKFINDNPQQGDVISFKINPTLKSGFSLCCCSNCLQEFWEAVNDKISPQGPIEHEGSAILKIDDEQIILEQHENGPEIKAFLVSLAAAFVYDFVKWLLLSCISAFKKKGATGIRIYRKITTTKQKIVEESIFEIDIDEVKSEKELNEIIDNFLKRKSL